MNRYSVIDSKLQREFVLLQGTGCRWKQCLFCDYHKDVSDNPFCVNADVLGRVTGVYGVCLLCCTEGENKECIVNDIETADRFFEYFSVNIFCNNSTPVKQDRELVSWFLKSIFPSIKDNPKAEILLENTDLGVGD